MSKTFIDKACAVVPVFEKTVSVSESHTELASLKGIVYKREVVFSVGVFWFCCILNYLPRSSTIPQTFQQAVELFQEFFLGEGFLEGAEVL